MQNKGTHTQPYPNPAAEPDSTLRSPSAVSGKAKGFNPLHIAFLEM